MRVLEDARADSCQGAKADVMLLSPGDLAEAVAKLECNLPSFDDADCRSLELRGEQAHKFETLQASVRAYRLNDVVRALPKNGHLFAVNHRTGQRQECAHDIVGSLPFAGVGQSAPSTSADDANPEPLVPGKYVMLSYNWEHQPLVKRCVCDRGAGEANFRRRGRNWQTQKNKVIMVVAFPPFPLFCGNFNMTNSINQRLKEAGIPTWIDIEQMSQYRTIYDAMASAVEGAG